MAPHHGFIPSSAEDLLRHRVKSELRKRMRGVRRNLPPQAWTERSERLAERLGGVAAFSRARAVALFWPMEERREVDLRPVFRSLRGRGVRVAFPRAVPETGNLQFAFVEDEGRMVDGFSGLREPSADAPVAAAGDLDVVVVPALAIDPRGHRIGYGSGYYDRALPAFVPPAVAIGVAFDFQLVAEVPNTEGDVPVGTIVTDVRVLERESEK
jgi:5-formyltetrahydrofolate cyclo-ligase